MNENDVRPQTWSVPKQHIAIEVTKYGAITVSTVLLTILLTQIAAGLLAKSETLLVLASLFGLIVGYVLADFITGTVHWFCDTFFNGDTPLIGKVLIQPFRDHHTYPQRITKHKFVEQDTSSFFVMLPVLVYAVLTDIQFATAAEMFWLTLVVGLSIGLFLTNVFHKWAHVDEVPTLIRQFQRIGLILEPVRHRMHHGDHERAFCVTTGWLNPILDRVRFFPRTEGLVRRVLRRPKRGAGS
jgi:hypothetical protein